MSRLHSYEPLISIVTVFGSSLENAYAHLVNNSIGKHSENFNRKVSCKIYRTSVGLYQNNFTALQVRAENGEEIEGYMWPYETFREYIRYRASGQDLVTAKIKPRMQVCELGM